MIGIFLIIFQKRDNPGFAITEIKKDTVATGEIVKGIKYGNKGGVGWLTFGSFWKVKRRKTLTNF